MFMNHNELSEMYAEGALDTLVEVVEATLDNLRVCGGDGWTRERLFEVLLERTKA